MSARVSWRVLTLTQLRAQPLRLALTALAIGMGVALGTAVYLINSAALDDFERATRRLLGTADLTVRATAQGFDQQLFPRLARLPQVEELAPMLDLAVTLPNRRESLEILGIDAFRAGTLQPELAAAIAPDVTRLFAADAIVLARTAADELGVTKGADLQVIVGSQSRTLRVVDVLPADVLPGAAAVMDIASAQWSLARLGRLNRIDLRLRTGVDASAFRSELVASLPPGVIVRTPALDVADEATATRAYRVNLNMLASVALLTGAFLVFSSQSLAVLRRRGALGLLRALGATRAEVQRALLGEGVAIGLIGSVLGLVLGALLAAAVLHYRGADLGDAQLRSLSGALMLHPWPMLAFLLTGTGAAVLGAWLPAREAAARAPALALHAGDAETAFDAMALTAPGIALMLGGGLLALLPARDGLPWSGYASIGLLLLGAVLLLPALTRAAFALIPRSGHAVLDLCRAQLRGSAASSIVSLAAIVVSFSLMVAMAIMVHSFRDSFELWLVKLLPADLQLRAAVGTDTGALSFEQQQRIAQLPSIARVEFRRVQQLYLSAQRAPISLIARPISLLHPEAVLPLVHTGAASAATAAGTAGPRPAWVSEALADQPGYRLGSPLELPLAGRLERFQVMGVWRDYQHAGGAVVINRGDYIALTGDRTATEGSIWQRPHRDERETESAIRALLGGAQALELLSSQSLRERSLNIFDRVFAITYALEAVAVLVGLAGISVAASSGALARRAQFGMLRHIGMLRRQVLQLLACEGIALSTLACLLGLALGSLLSLVLIYVINRRSFHWSIDLSMPWSELTALSVGLIAAAAITAVWSGRTALGQDPVRAVREDW